MYSKALKTVGLVALMGVQLSEGSLERKVRAETPYPQFDRAVALLPSPSPNFEMPEPEPAGGSERDAFYEFMKLQGWEFDSNYNPYVDINLELNIKTVPIPQGVQTTLSTSSPVIKKREQPKTLEEVKSEFSEAFPQYEFHIDPRAYNGKDSKLLENHYSIWEKPRR